MRSPRAHRGACARRRAEQGARGGPGLSADWLPFSGLRVLAVGHVTHDRYGDDICAGGSAYYAARTWQSFGATAAIATAVGDDFICASAWGDVEVLCAVGGETTTFANRHDADGNVVRGVERVAPRVEPAVLTAAWRRCDAVLLAPVFGEVAVDAWLDAVDAGTVGLSLQGLVRRSMAGRVVPSALALSPRTLHRCDVVVFSEEDVAPSARSSTLALLRSVVPAVVLTRGRSGSRLFTSEGTWDVGVFDVSAVDPTGAGDGFLAAMVLAMASGMTAVEAARLGAAVASVIVQGRAGDSLDAVAESAMERAKGIELRRIPETRV